MFKNQDLIKVINKEQRHARQFIIAATLVIVVVGNSLIYISQQIEELPRAYWLQLAFIPVLLIIMAFMYFRLHKKEMTRIKTNFEDIQNSTIESVDSEIKD